MSDTKLYMRFPWKHLLPSESEHTNGYTNASVSGTGTTFRLKLNQDASDGSDDDNTIAYASFISLGDLELAYEVNGLSAVLIADVIAKLHLNRKENNVDRTHRTLIAFVPFKSSVLFELLKRGFGIRSVSPDRHEPHEDLRRTLHIAENLKCIEKMAYECKVEEDDEKNGKKKIKKNGKKKNNENKPLIFTKDEDGNNTWLNNCVHSKATNLQSKKPCSVQDVRVASPCCQKNEEWCMHMWETNENGKRGTDACREAAKCLYTYTQDEGSDSHVSPGYGKEEGEEEAAEEAAEEVSHKSVWRLMKNGEEEYRGYSDTIMDIAIVQYLGDGFEYEGTELSCPLEKQDSQKQDLQKDTTTLAPAGHEYTCYLRNGTYYRDASSNDLIVLTAQLNSMLGRDHTNTKNNIVTTQHVVPQSNLWEPTVDVKTHISQLLFTPRMSARISDPEGKPVVSKKHDTEEITGIPPYLEKLQRRTGGQTTFAILKQMCEELRDAAGDEKICSKGGSDNQETVYRRLVEAAKRGKWKYTEDTDPRWNKVEKAPSLDTGIICRVPAEHWYHTFIEEKSDKLQIRSHFYIPTSDFRYHGVTYEKTHDISDLQLSKKLAGDLNLRTCTQESTFRGSHPEYQKLFLEMLAKEKDKHPTLLAAAQHVKLLLIQRGLFPGATAMEGFPGATGMGGEDATRTLHEAEVTATGMGGEDATRTLHESEVITDKSVRQHKGLKVCAMSFNYKPSTKYTFETDFVTDNDWKGPLKVSWGEKVKDGPHLILTYIRRVDQIHPKNDVQNIFEEGEEAEAKVKKVKKVKPDTRWFRVKDEQGTMYDIYYVPVLAYEPDLRRLWTAQMDEQKSLSLNHLYKTFPDFQETPWCMHVKELESNKDIHELSATYAIHLPLVNDSQHDKFVYCAESKQLHVFTKIEELDCSDASTMPGHVLITPECGERHNMLAPKIEKIEKKVNDWDPPFRSSTYSVPVVKLTELTKTAVPNISAQNTVHTLDLIKLDDVDWVYPVTSQFFEKGDYFCLKGNERDEHQYYENKYISCGEPESLIRENPNTTYKIHMRKVTLLSADDLTMRTWRKSEDETSTCTKKSSSPIKAALEGKLEISPSNELKVFRCDLDNTNPTELHVHGHTYKAKEYPTIHCIQSFEKHPHYKVGVQDDNGKDPEKHQCFDTTDVFMFRDSYFYNYSDQYVFITTDDTPVKDGNKFRYDMMATVPHHCLFDTPRCPESIENFLKDSLSESNLLKARFDIRMYMGKLWDDEKVPKLKEDDDAHETTNLREEINEEIHNLSLASRVNQELNRDDVLSVSIKDSKDALVGFFMLYNWNCETIGKERCDAPTGSIPDVYELVLGWSTEYIKWSHTGQADVVATLDSSCYPEQLTIQQGEETIELECLTGEERANMDGTNVDEWTEFRTVDGSLVLISPNQYYLKVRNLIFDNRKEYAKHQTLVFDERSWHKHGFAVPAREIVDTDFVHHLCQKISTLTRRHCVVRGKKLSVDEPAAHARTHFLRAFQFPVRFDSASRNITYPYGTYIVDDDPLTIEWSQTGQTTPVYRVENSSGGDNFNPLHVERLFVFRRPLLYEQLENSADSTTQQIADAPKTVETTNVVDAWIELGMLLR